MRKIEIFGLWLCLLGVFLLAIAGFGNWGYGLYISIILFLIGSFLVLNSLWNRRKDK